MPSVMLSAKGIAGLASLVASFPGSHANPNPNSPSLAGRASWERNALMKNELFIVCSTLHVCR